MALKSAHIAAFMLMTGGAHAHPAIHAFTAFCFKAGQTPAQAHANMASVAGNPLPFTLTFWDKTIVPAPGTPEITERRCEVTFDGDHADDALRDVQAKMATPPVFGTSIPLTPPYVATDTTVYIDARELLRKRVAVVHIGTKGAQTFIRVDRLPAGKGLPNG
ncbi:hypothetical protein [Tateyamaria sp.]|uniref:hypothetical protein n=1 Tax=Tateyamaria sp. TaxID=1929288 RepID=UPI00329EA42F